MIRNELSDETSDIWYLLISLDKIFVAFVEYE